MAPSADNPTDPNYQTLWDFLEATWHKYVDHDPRTILHVNTTQVDAFGLAFKVEYSGFDPSKDKRTKPLTIFGWIRFGHGKKKHFQRLGPSGNSLEQAYHCLALAPSTDAAQGN